MKSIFKIFIALLVIVALAAALLLFIRNQTDSSVVKYYEKRGYSISQPLTVAEIEAKSLEELQNAPHRCPRVPFGYINAHWIRLKDQIQPGDEILFISSTEKSVHILEGYILVRKNKIIDMFVMSIEGDFLPEVSTYDRLRWNFKNIVAEVKCWF
jgi:hypothetical protein